MINIPEDFKFMLNFLKNKHKDVHKLEEGLENKSQQEVISLFLNRYLRSYV